MRKRRLSQSIMFRRLDFFGLNKTSSLYSNTIYGSHRRSTFIFLFQILFPARNSLITLLVSECRAAFERSEDPECPSQSKSKLCLVLSKKIHR